MSYINKGKYTIYPTAPPMKEIVKVSDDSVISNLACYSKKIHKGNKIVERYIDYKCPNPNGNIGNILIAKAVLPKEY
jgi:hypothetical protein